jgi:hypothetical protein
VVQEYTTRQFAMAYSNNMLSYDMGDNSSSIQLFVDALRTDAVWGYWTVAAILACHLGLVAVIAISYLRVCGHEDLLGNAWSAVGQLRSEEIDAILDCTEASTDREVKVMLKRKGVYDRPVGLSQDRSGRCRIGSSD